MKTFLLLVFTVLSLYVSACSGVQKTFCYVHSLRTSDPVICGRISSVNANSIDLTVIDVLSGSESRSVITVWSGKDYDCNGKVSMKASDLGGTGDTVIVILPLITSAQSTFEVVGDYRRPISLFETAWVQVKNKMVTGLIAGSSSQQLMTYPYAGFKKHWQENSNDCTFLNLPKTAYEEIEMTVRDNNLIIDAVSEPGLSVQIMSIDGRKMVSKVLEGETVIDCSQLQSGIYLVSIRRNSQVVSTHKMLL